MIESVLLPEDRFEDNQLKDLKQKTIIFGKNGTGKSSIVAAINEQYSNDYDLRIFQGFEGLVGDNKKLNSIVLGRENTEIQSQITTKEGEIAKLEEKIISKGEELESAKSEENKVNKTLQDFYKKSASTLKREKELDMSVNLDKNDFEKLISKRQELSQDEIKQQRGILHEIVPKSEIDTYLLPKDIDESFIKAKELCAKEVLNQSALEFKEPSQEKWVRDGVEIHSGECSCLFCGGMISKERWQQLNQLVNDKVKSLDIEIENLIVSIRGKKNKISSIQLLDKNYFYQAFHSRVIECNNKLLLKKEELIEFYEKLLELLNEKKRNLYLKYELNLGNMPSFMSIQMEINKIYDENKAYTKNLTKTQSAARDKLLYHRVYEMCKHEEYETRIAELKCKQERVETLKNEYNKLQDEKKSLLNELGQLQSQAKDEERAAARINELLKSVNMHSFELRKTDMTGQYSIIGCNGEPRDIETLSTGEKNIVALLWFIFDLENLEKLAGKPQVIIFDDPMNSNDDTVQYLIITELQKLLRSTSGDNQIIILTHNIHFYINLRYQWWSNPKKNKNKKSTIHLYKGKNLTYIKEISCGDDDLKTSYDALWFEVHFLYTNNQPNLMLNPLRRIFETYEKFSGINLFTNFKSEEKLFNANSHGIDDFEADLNGLTKKEIIKSVKRIFSACGAEDHFRYHWKINEEEIDK